MIVFILAAIVLLIYLGIPFVKGYREQAQVNQKKKEDDEKEARIRANMKEYKKIISNEPNRPEDHLALLLNKSYMNKNDPWSLWYKTKQEFEGYGSFYSLDEKAVAVKRVKDELNPPVKIKEKEFLERTRGIVFKVYPDFSEITKVITDKKISFGENVSNWENELIEMTKAIKILKSIESSFYKNRDNYNILYKSKIFLSPTTLKFEYDKNTYTLIVSTGLSFNGSTNEIRNQPISFKALEEQYSEIITKMQRQIPKSRFDNVIDRIKKIANQ